MKKFFNSFVYAAAGVKHCFKKETNFKVQVTAACTAVLLAILFKCTGTEWMILLICIALVISLEMINTAVERLCNMHGTGYDPQIKIIKDVAAGAVLLSAIIAAICGAIIFIPKIILFF